MITPAQVKELYNISKPAMPTPLHRWNLDEEVAGPVVDSGASPINGTNSGALINQDGFRGKCHYFEGGAYVNLLSSSNADALGNVFTITGWFKSESTTGITAARIYTRDVSDYYGLAVWQSTGYPQVCRFYGSSANTFDSTLSEGWHHFAHVIDKNNLIHKGYIDGEYLNEATLSILTSSRPMVLGVNTEDVPSANNAFIGKMRDFRIYASKLNPRQIKDIYRGLA